MTIRELENLISDGKFHHATEKPNLGVHSGLWIYEADVNAPRGFKVAGFFSGYKGGEHAESYKRAIAILRSTGISVGSYGNG